MLNELSPGEQERFEEAYFSDGRLFEQVQALEEELIEDYVKGNLSVRERSLFERHYLGSDERCARVETARQLVELCSLKAEAQAAHYGRIEDSRTERRFFSIRSHLQSLAEWRLTPVFGVAAAILLLLGAGLAVELLRLRGRLAAVSEERVAVERRAEESDRRLASERERLAEERKQNADLLAKLENRNSRPVQLDQRPVRSQALNNQIVFLPLTPSVRGGDKPDRAVLSDHTRFLELRIELEAQEAEYSRSYRAVVKTVDGGREIWAREGIKPQRRKSAQYVVVRAPADRFKAAGAQDFMLTLGALAAGGKGYEELESLYFQVIH
ncbi:MAG: hypothetical protein J2P52_01175 [Blastocatellia bacterium]|nr:hypothetical protein [Blastocatellia bacterium]